MNDKYFHNSPFAAKCFYNFAQSAQTPRHRWYYFKEGFSASLVKEAIESIANSTKRKLSLLDPFCGSGTTPLTAALLGHGCIGIEVNPFLAFVSRAKNTPKKWRRTNYLSRLAEIDRFSIADCTSPLEGFSTFSEKDGCDKWLFNRDVLRKFTAIMHSIERVSSSYDSAFVLAAMVAAFQSSNVKRDGKALRYKHNWEQLNYSGKDVLKKFTEHALMIIDDVENFPIKEGNQADIINADVRIALGTLDSESFDLVVTSPPYLNSFDYSDVYRPELFLGNYVINNKELAQLRLRTIRSHIQVAWPRETTVECDLLTPILKKLAESENLWDSRIPLMVKAYFDDINQVLHVVAKKLKRQGQMWMVVSTSAYGGIHIPVDLIIASLAHDAGFVLEGIHRLRDLRTSGQQWKLLNTKHLPLRESLIILTKP